MRSSRVTARSRCPRLGSRRYSHANELSSRDTATEVRYADSEIRADDQKFPDLRLRCSRDGAALAVAAELVRNVPADRPAWSTCCRSPAPALSMTFNARSTSAI